MDALNASDGALLGDDAAGFAIGAVLVVGTLVILLFLPLALLLLELIVLPLVLLRRIALGRPWTVEARAREGGVMRWSVAGWRASGAKVREVERALAAGEL